MPFVTEVPVRFGDTDQAGIVYYPRLLHLLHIAFEELIAEVVGLPYAELMAKRNTGFPTVHMECEFTAPLRYGEVLAVATTVPEVGRTSARFEHVVTVDGDGDRRAWASIKRVAVDMRTLRPVPVPDDVRAAFARIVR